jgi:hypothetical protein
MRIAGAVIIVGCLALFGLMAPAPAQVQANATRTLPISEQAARGMISSTVGSCGCEVVPAGTTELPGWRPVLIQR